MDIKNIMVIRGMNKNKNLHLPPKLTRDNVFSRDKQLCAYCVEEFPKSKLTWDHVIPKSLGGKNSWINLVTACTTCNNKKGNTPLDQLVGIKLAYVPYVPNRASQLILSNRRILVDQMDYLKAFKVNKGMN
jgi:5-methylcytosine-specific restriction endonuclease McrA